MTEVPVPEGFASRVEGARTLLVRHDLLEDAVEEGLARKARWDEILGEARGGPGRGAAARIELRSGARLVLKKMRRGGLVGSMWRERYAGAARLLSNLTVPREVSRRGVATAAPAVLLLEEGPKGLFQGWLGTDEIPNARDLMTRLAEVPPPSREAMTAAATMVRRAHDAGVEHRDLNLGNLLVREDRAPEAFLVDLDRARLHPGPLPLALRREALQRLGRSYEKRFGRSGALGADGFRAWCDLYAGEDADLEQRLLRGASLGRVPLALHRLLWSASARRSRPGS
jgi:hypothetical protein